VTAPVMPFRLEPHEVQANLWIKLSDELNKRLDLARKRNDGALDEIATATLRGEIRVLKSILAFADQRSPMQTTDDHD
jgi:hypothetical protein